MDWVNVSLPAAWSRQQPIFDAISEKGMGGYVSGINRLEDAFKLKDRSLRCIDEGTAGGVHLAASGILYGFDETLRFCRTAGVSTVTAHEGCGACKIHAKKESLPLDVADTYGIKWSKKLANELNVPYEFIPA
ncbi:MAG: hypothetical protein V1744_08715, partial [Candidatus Altiarchaeota archaeon]